MTTNDDRTGNALAEEVARLENDALELRKITSSSPWIFEEIGMYLDRMDGRLSTIRNLFADEHVAAWGMDPLTTSSDAVIEALKALDETFGARFVLCDDFKRPVEGENEWLSGSRPTWARAAIHIGNGGYIGIAPWSIGLTGIDVDYGGPQPLIDLARPLARVRSPQGWHLYYPDDRPRDDFGERKWWESSYEGWQAAGNIRGATGYLILYDDAPVHLARALQSELVKPVRDPRIATFLQVSSLLTFTDTRPEVIQRQRDYEHYLCGLEHRDEEE